MTSIHERLGRSQRRATGVGVVALVGLAIAGFVGGTDALMQSWLVGFLAWLAISAGSLAFLLLHNLTGGGWGHAIRRVLEASTRTLPLMALLSLPLLIWPEVLWEWARPDVVAADPLLQHKEPFLNVGFFRVRTVVYFAIWIGLSVLCRRLSAFDERQRSEESGHRLRTISGPALGIWGLTVTFGAIDWCMSLDPHWFSTMYGVSFIVGFGLSALCFSVLVASRLSQHEPVAEHVETGQFHDLGNLMLAFTMLWAYIAFSQYLIIWSGDLAEEAPYYLARLGPGWQGLALFLLLFHFAMPFFLLLSRRTKRGRGMLATLALFILVMRVADLTWVVVPSFGRHGWLGGFVVDLLAIAGIGGLWVRQFAGALKSGPLFSDAPAKDTKAEAPSHA